MSTFYPKVIGDYLPINFVECALPVDTKFETQPRELILRFQPWNQRIDLVYDLDIEDQAVCLQRFNHMRATLLMVRRLEFSIRSNCRFMEEPIRRLLSETQHLKELGFSCDVAFPLERFVPHSCKAEKIFIDIGRGNRLRYRNPLHDFLIMPRLMKLITYSRLGCADNNFELPSKLVIQQPNLLSLRDLNVEYFREITRPRRLRLRWETISILKRFLPIDIIRLIITYSNWYDNECLHS